MAGASGRHRLGFVMLMLVTATLFLRPAEVFSGLGALPIYEMLMIGALVTSLPAVLGQFGASALQSRPWVLCVLALLPAIVMSNLVHGSLWGAREGGVGFAKILLLYLLLAGLLDSPDRLRRFLLVTTIFITVTASLAVLRYHGILDLQGMKVLAQNGGVDGDTGESQVIMRLQASGVFSDPNDFSLVLAVGILVLADGVLRWRSWVWKVLAALPGAILFYAFVLTKSRGGFLALLAGGAVLAVSRLGWRRAALIGVVAVPGMLALAGARQTDIDLNDSDDSAVGRILLWRDGLSFFRSAPVFGIGWGRYADEAGLVAHNSYVHCFAELGAFGGMAFVGAFVIPIGALYAVRRGPTGPAPALPLQLREVRACVLGVATAYAVGLFSLSRPYAAPTYLVLGSVGSFCNLIASQYPGTMPRANGRLLAYLCLASIGCLILVYGFIVVFAR